MSVMVLAATMTSVSESSAKHRRGMAGVENYELSFWHVPGLSGLHLRCAGGRLYSPTRIRRRFVVLASKTRVHRASFCRVAELPSTGRRRRWWCHDHVRSQRRSVGMASSLPMLTTTCASIAAARSRVWAHTTTCCDTSFDVAQQHVQRSGTGRVSTVSECGEPVRIRY